MDNKDKFEIPFPLSKEVKANLKVYLDTVKHDNDDLLIVLDGKEGSGKSVLAMQLGWYCSEYLNKKFSVKNIHFELQKYIDYSLESENQTIHILDEARNVLNRKSSMSKGNKKFTNYMSECRSKNQVHIICLPAFHDLDTYIALWRMKFLIHLNKYFVESKTNESGYKLKRGNYTLYMNTPALQLKYENKYFYPKGFESHGYFNNYLVVDEKNYEKKKRAYTVEKYHSSAEIKELGIREKSWQTKSIKLINGLLERDVPESNIRDMLKMDKNTWKVFKHRNLKELQFPKKETLIM